MLYKDKIPPLTLWYIGVRICHTSLPLPLKGIRNKITLEQGTRIIFWMQSFIFQMKNVLTIRLVNQRKHLKTFCTVKQKLWEATVLDWTLVLGPNRLDQTKMESLLLNAVSLNSKEASGSQNRPVFFSWK